VHLVAISSEGGMMPQAKRGATKSESGAKTTASRPRAKRAAAGSSTGATRAGSSSAAGGQAESKSSPDARFEAAAERLRKLNERIIDAGKKTGGATLSSYEAALNAIAGAVERGPGSSDIEWVAQLATTQAKFIRDVTEAWTSAARDLIK
jgi:hypothetical protein